MSKKKQYNVYYNESFNSIESATGEHTYIETKFYRHIGAFTKKQIKRIENVLKHKSLSLSEIQYMIECNGKFMYYILGETICWYYVNACSGTKVNIPFEWNIEKAHDLVKEQLPESDSVYLRLGTVIVLGDSTKGPWKVQEQSHISHFKPITN